MMYLLFRYKNWNPKIYQEAGAGTRKVFAAFMSKELEERKKQIEEMQK